jgi:hypothetical protein
VEARFSTFEEFEVAGALETSIWLKNDCRLSTLLLPVFYPREAEDLLPLSKDEEEEEI